MSEVEWIMLLIKYELPWDQIEASADIGASDRCFLCVCVCVRVCVIVSQYWVLSAIKGLFHTKKNN